MKRQPIPILTSALLSLVSLLVSDAQAIEPNLACDGSVIAAGTLVPASAGALADPPEEGRPVPIEIGLQITELNEIDELTSSFRFEGYADFRLYDPRAAFDAAAEGRPTLRYAGIDAEAPIWNVKLHVSNRVGPVEVTQRLVEIDADGSIHVSG